MTDEICQKVVYTLQNVWLKNLCVMSNVKDFPGKMARRLADLPTEQTQLIT